MDLPVAIYDRLALQEILDDVGSKFVTPHVNIFYCFGGLVLHEFVSQVATGFALTFYYRPCPSIMSDVHSGWLIRSGHRWGASIMVCWIVLPAPLSDLTGGFKKAREVTWISGVALAVCTVSFGVTGYSLPYDQVGYWALRIVSGVPDCIPVVIHSGPNTLAMNLPEAFNFGVFCPVVDLQTGNYAVTSLPIVETQEGDVSAYIPTNVIDYRRICRCALTFHDFSAREQEFATFGGHNGGRSMQLWASDAAMNYTSGSRARCLFALVGGQDRDELYIRAGFSRFWRPQRWASRNFTTLGVCTVSFGVTGHALPYDQVGYWALRIVSGVPDCIPVVGQVLVELIRGGPSVGQATLTPTHICAPARHIGTDALSLFIDKRRSC